MEIHLTSKPYHNMEMHPHEHIPRDHQPFYTKFLNKRDKQKYGKDD